ncbi:glycosyl hydrolase family 61-domain-containing protein [Massariosphaeria phaeospora]|uniref:AA9 family lytic polysaccharide monooxygenase n=1 Tax=Massariosphaeria phaeospora TaxID=100035 RepID=A0A7C8MKB0_9PLEO|nr:glycosyl hydrolase family 61-domain-containing protein [Massariosphaeria phaeospora]
MRASTILALAAAGGAQLAAAHTTVQAVWVNGKDQGTKTGIRSPPNNDPIKDVTSASMTCNVGGTKAAAQSISVAGGDKITLEWAHDTRGDDIIASSHNGPVMTYIAPAASNGEGNVWVKIQESGYANGKWAVENLIANKGKYDLTLPKIAAGDYLLRSEIIALHEGNQLGGAQFYMECVQIKVGAGGSTTLPAGVAIPGAYKATDPGVHFQYYNAEGSSYIVPGPKLWDGASGGAAPVASAAPASSAKPAATSAAASPATPAKTTMATVVKPAATSTPAPAAGGSAAKYAQCGGNNYSGATACASGLTCKVQNPYYSQCL